MSTTLLKRLDCGCEFLAQLDTWGLLSLRIDVCEVDHRTEIGAARELFGQMNKLEAEIERLKADIKRHTDENEELRGLLGTALSRSLAFEAERDAYREALLATRAYHVNNNGENAGRRKAALPKGRDSDG